MMVLNAPAAKTLMKNLNPEISTEYPLFKPCYKLLSLNSVYWDKFEYVHKDMQREF